jgi:hypothetical protein
MTYFYRESALKSTTDRLRKFLPIKSNTEELAIVDSSGFDEEISHEILLTEY